MITIADKNVLALLTHEPKEVQYRYFDFQERDKKGRQGKLALVAILTMAAREGVLVEYPGRKADIQKLVREGYLEKICDSSQLYNADEKPDDVEIYRLTALGQDVYRYHLGVTEIDRQDIRALQELKTKGRRAMYQMSQTALFPTNKKMLEDLFFAGMLERVGRGGKRLSKRRAKQLKYEPLDPDRLRVTERFQRCIDRIGKKGEYWKETPTQYKAA